MATSAENGRIRRNHDVLVSSYRRALTPFMKRIRQGTSIRRVSRELKISHTLMQNILEDPQKTVSRKTMLKYLRPGTKPARKKKAFRHPKAIGRWIPDMI